jgi:hypothetical protein
VRVRLAAVSIAVLALIVGGIIKLTNVTMQDEDFQPRTM